MKDITDKNFGLIIAFALPGFLLLWGLSFSFDDIGSWLAKSDEPHGPSLGGFLYSTLASLSIGLLISAVRWLIVDHLLSFFGSQVDVFQSLRRPELDFSRLTEKDVFTAFTGAVENYYRYYQYYSNTLIAVAVAFGACIYSGKALWMSKLSLGSVMIGITLLLASADSLSKYYKSASQILGPARGTANDERLGTQENIDQEGSSEEISQEVDGEESR
jgi:hypothetical protein